MLISAMASAGYVPKKAIKKVSREAYVLLRRRERKRGPGDSQTPVNAMNRF